MKGKGGFLCVCLAVMLLAFFPGCEQYPDLDPAKVYNQFFGNDPNDLDGDGLLNDEETALGTSPELPDTDGDGFSDYDEVVIYGWSENSVNRYDFNPLIADLPDFSINLTSPPVLVFDLESSTGATKHIEYGTEETSSQSYTSTDMWHWSFGLEVEYGYKWGTDFGSHVNIKASTEIGEEHATERSWENSKTLSSMESFEQTEGVTLISGIIRMAGEVVNRSSYAYTVDNMILAAYILDPETGVMPVGHLVADVSGTFQPFPHFTIGPGQAVGPIVFVEDHLDVGTTKKILENMNSFMVTPIISELSDAEGVALTFNMTQVNNMCATISIDYGPMVNGEGMYGRPRNEIYYVATKADPENPGMPLATALNDVLAVEPLFSGTELISVRGVEKYEMGLLKGYWQVSYRRYDGLKWIDVPFEGLDNTVLQAGEVLGFAYIEDADGDGVTGRYETAYGLNLENEDTDGDGRNDLYELENMLDPANPDTDFDGLNDGIDPNPKDKNYYSISAGHSHSLMVNAVGELYGWGSNRDPDYTSRPTYATGSTAAMVNVPTRVGSSSDWVTVSAGENHSAAIDKFGQLFTWGDNQGTKDFAWHAHLSAPFRDAGKTCQLGWTDQNGPYATPTLVNSDTDWVFVSAGYTQTHALKLDGSHWAWGDNDLGALGIGQPYDPICSPALVGSEFERWVYVDAGRNLHFAIKSDGTLWAAGTDACWMNRAESQDNIDLMFYGTYFCGWGNQLADLFVQKNSNNDVGWHMDCTDPDNDECFADPVWNQHKNCGMAFLPQQIIEGSTAQGAPKITWDSVDASLMNGMFYYNSACSGIVCRYFENPAYGLAISGNGYLYGWGDNDYSQLLSIVGVGTSTITMTDNPGVHVMGNGWHQVSAGGGHVLGIKMDGTLWAWGRNASGQAGKDPGVQTRVSFPLQIGTDNDWAMASAGYQFSLAMKNDGTVWAWGADDKGQRGDGAGTTSSWVPVCIASVVPSVSCPAP